MEDKVVMSEPNAAEHTAPAEQTAEKPAKNKRKIWKTLLIVLSFVAVCTAIALLLNDVLRKKWNFNAHAAQQIVQGYYEEGDHTIDVLCLGSSVVRNGVSSLEMYHDYGFTTYSRATSVQLPVVSYYLLQETLDRQDVKAVVIDASTLTNTLLSGYSKEEIVGKIHEAIDFMPMSTHRIKLVREILKLDLNASLADFLIPLYAYHDRWEEIGKDDFTYRQWQDDYYYKGQNPRIVSVAHSYDAKYMTEADEAADALWIERDSAAWYEEMIRLCKEKGIEFVMIKTPNEGWNLQYYGILNDFAEAHQVKYIDFNLLDIQQEIGFNPKQDFCDSVGHLNVTGASKLSKYLGEYLTSVCSFTDKRNDPAYASWNDDYEKYANLLQDAELRRETNLIAYLQRLKNPDYLTIIAARDNTSRNFNDEVAAAFADLGIDQPFKDHLYFSFLAVLNGEEVVHQEGDRDPTDDDPELTYSTEVDGHTISVTSFSARTSNDATILLDGESVSPNARGFNFVVYDKKVRQIVSQKTFNTGLKGVNYTKPDPFGPVAKDPIGYLDMLNNEDYITVIGVRGDGSRYIPGVVNQKLVKMGLLPLDGEFGRPYLAVLNGSDVVYNEYGDVGTEISFDGEIENIPVTAVSSTVDGKNNFFSQIEDEKASAVGRGLTLHVYSKTHHVTVSKNRFDWRTNYVTGLSVDKINNLDVLLTLAQKEGDDICLLYVPSTANKKVSEEIANTFAANGMDRFDGSKCFAAVLYADGTRKQISGLDQAAMNFSIDGISFRLSADSEGKSVTVNDVVYTPEKDGLYVLVYNAENQAVLTEKYFATSDVDITFRDIKNDPIAYLEHTADSDYITVIGVSGDGMKCIPAAVNRKLADMGLLPLDGEEFKRPYLAILNGSEVVYNEYGEVESQISVSRNTDGVEITAVSSTVEGEANFYTLMNDAELKTKAKGLLIAVYSKSRECLVSSVRYNWAGTNYVTGKAYSKINNLRELIAAAKMDQCELYFAYSPKLSEKGLSKDLLQILEDNGFTEFSKKKAFAAVLDTEGNLQQTVGSSKVSVELDRGGVPIIISANTQIVKIKVNGVKYHTTKPGLYVVVYSPEHETVLAEKVFGSD